MNAWPSSRELLLRGWLMRLAGGATRRTNSVNPLRGSNHDPRRIVEEAARIYAANNRPLFFRVPDLAAGMDAPLAALGFEVEAETCTLLAQFGDARPNDGVELMSFPSAEWLAVRSHFNGSDDANDRAYDAVVRAILLPKAFASVRDETGAIVSIAYAAIGNGFVIFESVATAEKARNRGYSRRAVAALMDWGKANGAKAACLQVVADNAPARALYARLGFTTELYRYHYRRAPA